MSTNIGIVGSGRWGQNYVRVFSDLAAPVVGVCDQDESRLDIIRQRYPRVRTFLDYRELLEVDTIDAVVVATPASTHYELSKSALLAGKDLLVEKPLVLVPEHGYELIELAERQGLSLMVGHVFMYNPGVMKLKQCITAGEDGVGKIYYVYAARTNLGPIRNDVNVVWDLAPHDVSIVNYLLNSFPLYVNAVGAKLLGNGLEDVAFITLTYPGGIMANIHVSWTDPNRVRQVVVVGDRKRVVFDDLNFQEKVRVFEKGVSVSGSDTDSFGEFMLSIRDGDIISPKVEVREPLKEQCANFLDSLQGRARPRVDANQGLEVVEILTAIQRSLEKDGERVECLSLLEHDGVPDESHLHRSPDRPGLAQVSQPTPE